MASTPETGDDFDIAPRRAAPRKVERTAEAKSARLLLWLIPTGLFLLIAGTRLVVTSSASKKAIAEKVATTLKNRTKSAVRLGGLTFGWAYQPCLQGVQIYRVQGQFETSVITQQACVDRWASAVGSGFRAVRIRLDDTSIQILGGAEKKESGGLVDVKPTKTGTPASAATGIAIAAANKAPLREFEVLFDDLRIDWNNLPIPAKVANGSFGPIDGALTVQTRGKQSAVSGTIREPRTGLVMTGRATPTKEGWDLSARMEGDLAPTFGPILTAAGVDIRKLPVTGEIGAVYSAEKKKVVIDLDMEQYDVDVANRSISSKRLAGFQAREKLRVQIDTAHSRLWIEDGLIEVNGIPMVFSVDLKPGATSPAFTIKLDIQTVPLAKLIRSIPGAEDPAMAKEMSSNVLFALSFALSGELRDPRTWQPKLEHRIVGIGANSEGSGLEFLRKPWEYRPLTKQGRSEQVYMMGPGTPSWVPYKKIPYAQRRAVQVSEDANFFLHNGIDIEEIQAAIVAGVESEKKQRGGSTLTQQLVKNLFLTRDRTAMRKVQEAVLTFLVESALSKEEIFETYMNIIEWGPGIYGINDAANYYFGRPPQRLSHKEMAYIATIIPGPILYHKYYEEGRVPAKHMAKVEILLDRLQKLNTITAEELAASQSESLHFTRHQGITAVKQTDPLPPDQAPKEE